MQGNNSVLTWNSIENYSCAVERYAIFFIDGPFLLFVQMDDEIGFTPVLPKEKDAPKEEPVDNSPLKPVSSGSVKGTPSTAKSAKGKRKLNGDDAKASNSVPPKKVKTENVCLYLFLITVFCIRLLYKFYLLYV